KIISIDLDGTLLKDDKTISKETLATLRKAESMGKHIVINTGRPRHRTESVLPSEFKKYIWICSNGGDIFQEKINIKKSQIETFEGYEIIKHIVEKYPSVRFGIDVGSDSITFFKDDVFYTEFKLSFQEFVGFQPQEIFSIFISLKDVEQKDYEELVKCIPESCRIMKTDLDLFATILPREVSKFSGIEYVSKQLGCTIDDVVAFGDDINDLEILERVKWGVAMGNAVTKIKSVCRIHTKSNEEEGVRHYLEKFILEKDSIDSRR
ncbi:MAG: Cof-type HAD-IIB family hydrolase, partial [Fusobacteria bacterium]|nr:Cof-type HAD-IIB family hydrolase [Fusobacteriota bacterium]